MSKIRNLWSFISILAVFMLMSMSSVSWAGEEINVYTIWSERYANEVFKAFTEETGIKVRYLRFSSGELLARLIAEKDNPQVDVFFGGIADAFVVGKKEGLFTPYTAPDAKEIPDKFKDPEGYWTGIAVDPISFMFNSKFLKKHDLEAPSSWEDLLDPAYKNGLIMADARTSGTAVSRLFSLVEAMGEDDAFAYQNKLDTNVQQYTQSGAGGALPIARGQAAGGIFFLVDSLEMQQKGYDVTISYPSEGIVYGLEAMAMIRGAKHPELAQKFIDWASGARMQKIYEEQNINLIPTYPGVKLHNPALDMSEVNLLDLDIEWSGANRKRLVERWINEISK